MFNYIRAELYRNFNRKYFWMFTGILVALPLAILIIGRGNNVQGVDFSIILNTSLYMLSAPVFLIAMIVDMTTAEENKFQTMRNVITFGVPRYKFILSKIIVSIILAFTSAVMILVVFYGVAAIMFGIDQGTAEVLPMFSVRLLTALPLWIGAISIGTFLGIAINNNTLFGFAYAGIFLLTSKVILVLSYIVSDKFMVLNKYLITTRLNNLRNLDLTASDLWTSVIIGIAYTVVFTAMSMLYFNKKEVK